MRTGTGRNVRVCGPGRDVRARGQGRAAVRVCGTGRNVRVRGPGRNARGRPRRTCPCPLFEETFLAELLLLWRMSSSSVAR